VELLVVITIIGILVMLLLPAVQTAREAARRTQCSNNLKQLGLGALQHVEKHGHFPSGGWGWYWVGDPDRGFTRRQPGGWIYNLLPYVEQEALHQLGAGKTGTAKMQDAGRLIQSPLSLLNCPSRRSSALYKGSVYAYNASAPPGAPSGVARTDYAACTGDAAPDEFCGGPGDQPTGDGWPPCNAMPSGQTANPCVNCWHDTTPHTGVSYQRSEIQVAHILDGTSNTIFAGEKYLVPDNYENGADGADNENAYTGYNNDNYRNGYWWMSGNTANGRTPMQDRPGMGNTFIFGSPHPAGCQIVLCDGSVRMMKYAVDPLTFGRLCNRKDRQVIDAANL
jgi:type II secretory pathway pseudopilin PulG